MSILKVNKKSNLRQGQSTMRNKKKMANGTKKYTNKKHNISKHRDREQWIFR